MTIRSAVRERRAKEGKKGQRRARGRFRSTRSVYRSRRSLVHTRLFIVRRRKKSRLRRDAENGKERARERERERGRDGTRIRERRLIGARHHILETRHTARRKDGARKRSFYSEGRKIGIFVRAPKWLVEKSRADYTGRPAERQSRSPDT